MCSPYAEKRPMLHGGGGGLGKEAFMQEDIFRASTWALQIQGESNFSTMALDYNDYLPCSQATATRLAMQEM